MDSFHQSQLLSQMPCGYDRNKKPVCVEHLKLGVVRRLLVQVLQDQDGMFWSLMFLCIRMLISLGGH